MTKQKVEKDSNQWNEWFAGLVDGDGCFYINKKKEISFELTTSILDSALLYHIQTQLKGGSVQRRTGSKSIRYRVKKKTIIQNIVLRCNGRLQHPSRLIQFKHACALLKIKFQPSPKQIHSNNRYLGGLIDSDGTLTISVSGFVQNKPQEVGKIEKQSRLENSRGWNQLTLKVSSKHEKLLLFVQQSYFIGTITKEEANVQNKKPNPIYHWVLRSEKDFQWLSAYLNAYPLKSVKMHRVHLTLHYFHLKKLKYHLQNNDTMEHKVWANFCQSWFKYSP